MDYLVESAPPRCDTHTTTRARAREVMTAVSLSTGRTPSAPPILTACNGDGALGCNRVPGDAA